MHIFISLIHVLVCILLVVIVPTLVSLLATTLYPAPSRMDLIVAAREAQTANEKSMQQTLDREAWLVRCSEQLRDRKAKGGG